ncbi:PxKF domain-containing protein [Deinococcus deserti]|uniref:Ig-like domain-containing protein n=1 Tax=Deinococcus deserti (strain DSM 17065 / CIP 109153 / LMG 22923 / VCD115) TaxID=546414 RepID=C1CUH0_DEIDV|nr:PxKF domain-containing protein [Deinococcus deserti]ACO45837.1 Hypothetical protein Deide_09590 [Deinococcus deserti VCD115]
MKRTLGGLFLALTLAACSQSDTPSSAPAPEAKASTPEAAASSPVLRRLDTVTLVNVTNHVVSGGRISRTPGQTGNPSFYMAETSNDNQNNCNFNNGQKGTLTLTSSDVSKIPNPPTVEITGCGTANPVTIPYTVASGATAGEVTLTATATGGHAGSTNTPTSFIVEIIIPSGTDTSPPVIVPTVTGTQGLNDWYTSDVQVVWSVTDGQSAITTRECPTPLIETDTNGTTVTCSATSAGGTSTRSVFIKRDATAPVISDANIVNTTWRKTNLSAAFTASDPTSGLATSTDDSFTLVASSESASATQPTVVSKTVRDAAGNVATRTVSALIDKTAPSVSGSDVTDPAWHKADVVSPTFTITETGSGLVDGTPSSFTLTAKDESTLSGTTVVPTTVSRTITDKAGNATIRTFSAKIDRTSPVISGSDTSVTTWTNSASVSSDPFTASDPLSGLADARLASFTLTATAESESATAPTLVSQTVTDAAGNSAVRTFSALIDRTAPTITGSRSPLAPPSGWNNANVTVSFSCDGTRSDVASCTTSQTVSTEGANQSVTGTVTDQAGNRATTTVTGISIDKTAPMVALALAGTAGLNDWYRSAVEVTTTGTDTASGSGGVNCSAKQTLSDETGSAGVTVSGSCTDAAGNTGSDSETVKIDRTAPTITGSRTPAANAQGWNNDNVAVSFTCTDARSGMGSCLGNKTVTTEGADQSVTGTATDNAGNSATATVGSISIDKTAPEISGADVNDTIWRKTPLSVSFTANDDTSGLETSTDASFSLTATADSTRVNGNPVPTTVSRTVKDKAGNTAVRTVNALIDTAKPTISGSTDSRANDKGWYTADVTVSFQCADALSGLKSCSASQKLTEGADQSATGTATDNAGNNETATLNGLKIDTSKPTIDYTLSSPVPASGWYTSDVTVTFTCADSVSGVASCPKAITVSADGPTEITGSVTDQAGHSASITPFTIQLDKTAPAISYVLRGTTGKNGWYTSDVIIDYTCTDAASGVNTCPADTTLTSSAASQLHTATDKAGNSGKVTVEAINIDKIAPVIDGSKLPTSIHASSFTAIPLLPLLSATDSGGSGLAGSGAITCNPTNLAINNLSTETNSVSCTVEDLAGNTSKFEQKVRVYIGNIWSGTHNFLSPLKSDPSDLSLAKSGSTVPLKFTAPQLATGPAVGLAKELTISRGFKALSITDKSYEITDVTLASTADWRYDAASNHYIHNLSTKGFAAGEYTYEVRYNGVLIARGAFNVKP